MLLSAAKRRSTWSDRGFSCMNQSADDFDFAFTIEEEIFVCDGNSYELVREIPPRFIAELRARLGTRATVEARPARIAITSHPFRLAAESVMDMPLLRKNLAGVAALHGLRALAAGMHPLGEQVRQTCGLRVRVSIPTGIDRAALTNRSIPWWPLYLAFSTSSPFLNGSLGGLLSCRQARFDEWPCVGPATNADALELNIADTCTRVEDSVAIANLFRCHVASLIRNPETGTDHTSHTHRIAEENHLRAQCDGIDAKFVCEGPAPVVSARASLARLLDCVDMEIARFGCGPLLTTLVEIANTGTSAHEQLRIYEECRRKGSSHRSALESVLQWLIEATAPSTHKHRELHRFPRRPFAARTSTHASIPDEHRWLTVPLLRTASDCD